MLQSFATCSDCAAASSIPTSPPVARGDTAPIILPNISIPESGGFVVANAIDSNRGLFIDESGRGVGGWAPNLRLFIMYELVFFGAPGVERFDFGVDRFVDDFGFCTPLLALRFVALFGVFGGVFTGVFFLLAPTVLAFFPLVGVAFGVASKSASFAARTDARLDAGTLRFLLFVVVLLFFVIVVQRGEANSEDWTGLTDAKEWHSQMLRRPQSDASIGESDQRALVVLSGFYASDWYV